jgi:hypothetical protein
MAETEALFEAAQRATSHAEDTVNTHREEISQLQKDVEDVKNLAKEEEEKRVKAISLLKSVRQKLVKAEKDREDAIKEVNSLKDREKGDKDKEHAERLNFQYEMESLTATHEKATTTLKSQFEKDSAAMRERYEQDIGSLRGQSELELASFKVIITQICDRLMWLTDLYLEFLLERTLCQELADNNFRELAQQCH